MKKIVIALAAATMFVFSGCFIDSDTATVRINLGNIPVAKVEKKSIIDRFLMIFAKEAVAQEVPNGIDVQVVHLGAFDSNNQLLAKKSINVTQGEPTPSAPPPTIVEFDVPARSGVTIVVLGEFTPVVAPGPPMITYYGKNDVPLNLTAGATETIIVNMQYGEYYLNGRDNQALNRVEWDRVTGANRYDVYLSSELVQSNNNTYIPGSNMSYDIKIYFGFVERESLINNTEDWFF